MQSFKNFLSKHRYPLMLTVFSMAVFFRWLSFDIFSFSDWGYRTDARLAEYLLFPVWQSGVELGQTDLTFWRTPINLLYGLFGSMGYASNVAEKFIVFWPLIVLPCLGSYYFIKKYIDNSLAAAAGSLVFGFNTYFIAINTQGHQLITAAAALGIFALIVHTSNVRQYSFGRTFLLSVLMVLVGSYDLRVLYVLLGFLLADTGYSWAVGKITIKTAAKVFLLPAVLFGLLSLFWVIPAMTSGDFTDNAILSRNLFGNNFWNLQSSLALHHPFWNGTKPDWFVVQQPAPYFYLVPLLAFLGLYINRKNLQILFFAVIAVLGILLGKQVDKPFAGLYPWLFAHVPGFGAFREGSKFFLLTAIGFSILIAALVAVLLNKRRTVARWRLYAGYSAIAALLVVTLLNVRPVVTGEIGTMFVARHIPRDYAVLNDFINKQPEYFRTYWLPRDSRWADHSDLHPKINGVELLETTWSKTFDKGQLDQNSMVQETIVDLFTQPYGKDVVSSAAVKYVVVPTKDEANDNNFFVYYGNDRQYFIDTLDNIDWLTKIDIGTEDLAVYENTNYKPAFTATNKLVGLEDYVELSGVASFMESIQLTGYSFKTDSDENFSTQIKSLFSTTRAQVDTVAPGLLDSGGGVTGGNHMLYKNRAAKFFGYTATPDSVEFYTESAPDMEINGDTVEFEPTQRQVLAQAALQPGKRYYVKLDDTTVLLERNSPQQLGEINNYEQVRLYEEGDNRIANAAFEDGLWRDGVGNCNQYDETPVIAMKRALDSDPAILYSLQLEATRHFACTSTLFDVEPSEDAVFSFNFQGTDQAQAGYYLQFNDPQNTTYSEKLVAGGTEDWQTFAKNIPVPQGATTADLNVYSYETDGITNNIIRYDNFSFSRPRDAAEVPLQRVADDFAATEVTLEDSNNRLLLQYDDMDIKNLIDNPSFEDGLWEEKVGDCNNYDANPRLDMRLGPGANANDRQSLQLEAVRHTACSTKHVLLDGFGDYVFGFSMQGGNKNGGGYYLKFNDSKGTVLTERIKVDELGAWQKVSRTIRVPLGATSASLTVYAYESDGRTANVVSYDDFSLMDIPDVEHSYYLVTEPQQTPAPPNSISYSSVNPTQKLASVQSATEPFTLSFADSFHPGWKVYLQPVDNPGGCEVVRTYQTAAVHNESDLKECKGSPSFAMGSGLSYLFQDPLFKNSHQELNGFANGWTVDPAYIKANFSPEYYTQNSDGSISFNLVVYFKPQSYFYVGLIASGLVLAACAGYTLWLSRSKQSKQKQYTIPEYKRL